MNDVTLFYNSVTLSLLKAPNFVLSKFINDVNQAQGTWLRVLTRCLAFDFDYFLSKSEDFEKINIVLYTNCIMGDPVFSNTYSY